MHAHGGGGEEAPLLQQMEGSVRLLFRPRHAPEPVVAAQTVKAELEAGVMPVFFQQVKHLPGQQTGIGEDYVDENPMLRQCPEDGFAVPPHEGLATGDVHPMYAA